MVIGMKKKKWYKNRQKSPQHTASGMSLPISYLARTMFPPNQSGMRMYSPGWCHLSVDKLPHSGKDWRDYMHLDWRMGMDKMINIAIIMLMQKKNQAKLAKLHMLNISYISYRLCWLSEASKFYATSILII